LVAKRGTTRNTALDTAVVISDIHRPFHDQRAINVAFDLIRDIKPKTVIVGGDVCDFFSISKYENSARRKLMLGDEVESAAQFFRELRQVAGKGARIIVVQGNHEMRLDLYLELNAPSVVDVTTEGKRVMSLENLFGLDKLGIEYVRGKRATKTAYTDWHGVLVGHFDALGAKAGDAAKKLTLKYRQSTVQGHTHRLGMVPYRHPDGSYVYGIESGCLCTLDPEYTECADWQHGLIVLTHDEDTSITHFQPVVIDNYNAFYNGKTYKG